MHWIIDWTTGCLIPHVGPVNVQLENTWGRRYKVRGCVGELGASPPHANTHIHVSLSSALSLCIYLYVCHIYIYRKRKREREREREKNRDTFVAGCIHMYTYMYIHVSHIIYNIHIYTYIYIYILAYDLYIYILYIHTSAGITNDKKSENTFDPNPDGIHEVCKTYSCEISGKHAKPF